MYTVHKGMNISSIDYDKIVGILAGVLYELKVPEDII